MAQDPLLCRRCVAHGNAGHFEVGTEQKFFDANKVPRRVGRVEYRSVRAIEIVVEPKVCAVDADAHQIVGPIATRL